MYTIFFLFLLSYLNSKYMLTLTRVCACSKHRATTLGQRLDIIYTFLFLPLTLLPLNIHWQSKNENFTPGANSLVACKGSERVVRKGWGFVYNLRQGVNNIQLIIKSWRMFELRKSLVELVSIYLFLWVVCRVEVRALSPPSSSRYL